jgi:predicted molibdopterin-dependent oxidoreductase YjgC
VVPLVIELSVDGKPLRAPAGQSIAAALLASGRKSLRRSPSGDPRGLYCGIGVCQECRVQADGRVVRACVTPVSAGMRVTTGYT